MESMTYQTTVEKVRNGGKFPWRATASNGIRETTGIGQSKSAAILAAIEELIHRPEDKPIDYEPCSKREQIMMKL